MDNHLKLLFNQSTHKEESESNIRSLIDCTNASLNSVKVLNIETENWDPIVKFLLIQKISKETHAAWELNQQGTIEVANLEDFLTFLEQRFRMLETLSDRPSTSTKPVRQVKSHATSISTPHTSSCSLCPDKHYLRVNFRSQKCSKKTSVLL